MIARGEPTGHHAQDRIHRGRDRQRLSQQRPSARQLAVRPRSIAIRPRGRCPAGSGGHTGAGPAAAPRRASAARRHGHRHSTPTSPGSSAPARHATRSSPRPAGPARSRQAAAWYGWLNASREFRDHPGDSAGARHRPAGRRAEPGQPGSQTTHSCRTPDHAGPAHPQAGDPNHDPSTRRRSPPPADASHRSQIPGRPAETARGSTPDAALLRPMMAPRLAARPDRRPADPQTHHSGHQRAAAPNSITLSDEEDRRERARSRRYGAGLGRLTWPAAPHKNG